MPKPTTTEYAPIPATKPKGGYRSIANLQICMAWWAYKSQLLKYFDFRVYLALHEVDERRAVENRKRKCANRPARQFRYDREKLVGEVHSLVGGVGGRYIIASLRRLQRAGLVRISAAGATFDKDPDRSPAGELSELWSMFERIDQRKRVRARFVPVPRTMIRHIVGGCSAARAATMLGYAVRCLFCKKGNMSAEGSCSVSFVAELFGVHPRTVKRARAELVSMGWLIRREADHWHVQRFGGRASVNLTWTDPLRRGGGVAGATRSTRLSPRPPIIDTEMSPPVTNRNLPSGKNQKPAKLRPDGACGQRCTLGVDRRLGHVALADLRNDHRLLKLFARACTARLTTKCEGDRLRFFAAAEHALRVGTRNPCGLFAATIRKRRWRMMTQVDEDRARARLSNSPAIHAGHSGRFPGTSGATVRRSPQEPPSAVDEQPDSGDMTRVLALVRDLAAQRSLPASCAPMNERNLCDWPVRNEGGPALPISGSAPSPPLGSGW